VNGGAKPHFRLLIAHNSTHRKPNVLQCEFIRYSGMANSLIFTLFVSQKVMPFCNKMFESGAGDRLGVDLGVLGETAWD
jgi:hypothetical protein